MEDLLVSVTSICCSLCSALHLCSSSTCNCSHCSSTPSLSTT